MAHPVSRFFVDHDPPIERVANSQRLLSCFCLVGYQICAINFLTLDRPNQPPTQKRYTIGYISVFVDTIARLTRFARKFVSSSGGAVPSTGRGRARLSDALSRATGHSYNYDRLYKYQAPNTIAKDVELERVAFPSQGGIIHPSELLRLGGKPERASVAKNLFRVVKPPGLWPWPTLHPCHRIAHDQEMLLTRKPLDLDMAVLVPDDRIPRGSD